MGKRGPLPKSRPERKLTGNASKRKLPKITNAGDHELPTCPAWIGAEGKAYWNRVVPIIVERMKVTEAEWGMLVNLCLAWDSIQECGKAIAKKGYFIRTKNGEQAINPAYKALEKSRIAFAKFSETFGLTPKTKGRLESIMENSAPPASAPEEHDDLDEFLEDE